MNTNSNQLSNKEHKTFKKMLNLLINSQKKLHNKKSPLPNKKSKKLNEDLIQKIKDCKILEEFKSILEEYMQAKKEGLFISTESFEGLARKSLQSIFSNKDSEC